MDGKSREAYLVKAQEAERIAAEMKEGDPHREGWLSLAKGWRDLAERIAHHSKT